MLYFLLLTLSLFSAEAIRIHCTYSVGRLWYLHEIYYCEATIVDIGTPQMISGITGSHLPGRTNNDVAGFRIRKQQIADLPLNIHEFFPNLQGYTVLHAGLSRVSSEDFKNLPYLRQIDFNFNEIQVLPRNLFIRNPLLEFISFDNNLVRHVAHHIFDNLQISTLALRYSTCINEAQTGRAEVSRMIFRIFQQCMPTTRMVAEEILSDPALTNVIDNQIDKRLETFMTRLIKIENTINDHEKRITYQEIKSISTVDSINVLMNRVFPQG